MTLKEIENLVFPKETVDWIEVTKELLKLNNKEGKLVTFKRKYLYKAGDEIIYLVGLGLVNGNLLGLTHAMYGDDFAGTTIGTACIGDEYSFIFTDGVGLCITENALKEACKDLFKLGKEDSCEIDGDVFAVETTFDLTDLSTMETGGWFINFAYLKYVYDNNEKVRTWLDAIISGEKNSCVNFYGY